MNGRTRTISILVLIIAAVAVAIPALTSAQSPGPRDITVLEKVRAVNFSRPHSERHFKVGDRVTTRQLLFDQTRNRVGTLTTDCVGVGHAASLFKATLQCTAVYNLADGTIVATGSVKIGSTTGSAAIVGGTGAYRAASGEVTAGTPVKGFDTVDVLHLD